MRTQVLNPAAPDASDVPPFAGMLDVECRVGVLLGTGVLTVRRLLGLRPNSLVELDQVAGDNLSLVVNGVTVARAEVVIIDDSTAMRVVEIASGADGNGAID